MRIPVIQSATLAEVDDKQRKVGCRIGQILTEVGFTNYTVHDPISTMIRHAPYVAGRHGSTDVRESLKNQLWTPKDNELCSRFNNVGDDSRGRTFTEMFQRFDPMGAPTTCRAGEGSRWPGNSSSKPATSRPPQPTSASAAAATTDRSTWSTEPMTST